MFKKVISVILTLFSLGAFINTAFAQTDDSYLKAVINTSEAVEVKKSIILDASQSFIPETNKKIRYEWDFGDGNKNEGVEVLHVYKQPGYYTATLKVTDGKLESETTKDVFVFRKMIMLITDNTEAEDRIKIIQDFAEKKEVYFFVLDSYGSSTEFISEEILTKKINEDTQALTKAKQIVIWTEENAGLNALSRFIQSNTKNLEEIFSQKTIIILGNDVASTKNRIQRQFEIIKPKTIIVTKEAAIDALIESDNNEQFLSTLKERGSEYEIVDSNSGKVKPWNFMSYFVSLMISNGIPDNTIALLLLLPVIATVIAFMRQVVGLTTFGIYTPSIITLSFLVIGMHAGILTLLAAITVGVITRYVLGHVRMLFIPKLAIVITMVSLTLFLILITSISLKFFDHTFLSIAIFPMLILSTLVEKFVTAKSEKGYASATLLMGETLIVSIIAYFIAGGEIDLWFTSFKFEFIKVILLTYPETVFLFIIINILLGKWTGLRLLEHIRFREVLRHIEE